MTVAGRVALVTGASRGIGRAIALALAEDGMHVAVHCRREREKAEAVAGEIRALGREAHVFAASLESREECVKLVADVVAAFGRLDVLVLNAGIASRGQSLADTDPAEVERLMRVHVFSAHDLCKAAVPQLRAAGRGDVIAISSSATLHHAANGGPYNMAKAALESLALTLAKEERDHGIRVNVVAPGLVETDMGVRLARGAMGVEDIRALDRHMPFGRVCQPEDVANAVRFFASDRASYLTGEILHVHGGGDRMTFGGGRRT
ncbi:MAG: SDR family oxidoreductase [Polyangiales bacterium]